MVLVEMLRESDAGTIVVGFILLAVLSGGCSLKIRPTVVRKVNLVVYTETTYWDVLNSELRNKAPIIPRPKRHIGFWGKFRETEIAVGAKIVIPF